MKKNPLQRLFATFIIVIIKERMILKTKEDETKGVKQKDKNDNKFNWKDCMKMTEAIEVYSRILVHPCLPYPVYPGEQIHS
jgi:hypothetical protein